MSHPARLTPLEIAVLLLGLFPFAARAVTAEPPPAAPGDSVFTEDEVSSLLAGAPEGPVELHGFVNLELGAFRDTPEARHPTFDIHNVFLSTKARVAPRASLFAEIEYEHGSTLKLDRAFVDYEVLPALTVRAGRFSSPFSYERIHYAAPVRLTTSRPYAVDVAFHEWVDTGVCVLGRVGWLGYNVAVVNGPRGLTEAGVPNVDVTDNNADKTVVARLNAYPTAALEAGLAGSTGAYDAAGRRRFWLAEADVRLRRGRLDLWAEVDWRGGDDEPCGQDDAGCDPSLAGERARKFGGYVLAAWDVMRDEGGVHYLKPLVRYDELHDVASGAAMRRVTAGLDWSPAPHLVLKSEGQWTFEAGPGAPDRWGAMCSIVADF